MSCRLMCRKPCGLAAVRLFLFYMDEIGNCQTSVLPHSLFSCTISYTQVLGESPSLLSDGEAVWLSLFHNGPGTGIG